jgi:hypothetical protein
VFARRGAAGHRKQPAEIVRDEVGLAVVERVDLRGERLEIGFDQAAETVVASQNEAARALRNRQVRVEELSREEPNIVIVVCARLEGERDGWIDDEKIAELVTNWRPPGSNRAPAPVSRRIQT